MKNLIICSATALLMSFGVVAQTTNSVNPEVKDGMKDFRKYKIDLAKDHRALRKELKEGDKASAKNISKEIRSDKKEIHQDVVALKEDGVKHPNRRANHQLAAAHRKRNR